MYWINLNKENTAIHLSNNTPVGWNDDYDFDNGYVDEDEETDKWYEQEVAKYHSEQEKDGKYTLFKSSF